jgi:hypothetical protein
VPGANPSGSRFRALPRQHQGGQPGELGFALLQFSATEPCAASWPHVNKFNVEMKKEPARSLSSGHRAGPLSSCCYDRVVSEFSGLSPALGLLVLPFRLVHHFTQPSLAPLSIMPEPIGMSRAAQGTIRTGRGHRDRRLRLASATPTVVSQARRANRRSDRIVSPSWQNAQPVKPLRFTSDLGCHGNRAAVAVHRHAERIPLRVV